MEKIEKVILTNMVLVKNEDKILVQERTKNDWPGLTLPGGHIKRNESLYDAAVREVYEETGLTISNLNLCGVEEFKTDKEDRYLIFFYKTNSFKGELHDSEEGKVFWIDRKDLNKYNLSLDLDLIIKVIEDDNISELHYYMDNDVWMKRLI